MAKLIALSGPAGSGKSTAAKYLVEWRGFTLVKFAAPLKDMLRAIGLSEHEIEGDLKQVPSDILCGQTPRHAMQTLGTEWGRDCIGSEFWVNAWARRVSTLSRVVCDDCRFENEAEAIRKFDGMIIGLSGRGGIEGSHVSEKGVSPDFILNNSGDIKNLHRSLDRLVNRA